MVTIKLVLDTRWKNEVNESQVKLRVTYNRQQKYYQTGIRLINEDFQQVLKSIPSKKFKTTKIELDEIMLKAQNAAKSLSIFSFLGFEKKFLNSYDVQESLYELYERIISDKFKKGTISTAISYRCSKKSLSLFNKKLTYVDITPDLLKTYEAKLLAEGKKITTIGIYLRPLRAILNEAISLGYFPKELYPFGRKKYIIPEGRNPKKALEVSDFRKIWDYSCPEARSFEARSKDFFILSYLCQGANIKDLLLLKKEQVLENELHFIRQKTKESGRSNPILIRVPVIDQARKIIEKWKSTDTESIYYFDFIKPTFNEEQIYKTVMQFVKVTNQNINKIALSVGVCKKVTTYVARHQFSKAIIEGGESVEYLSECLGHKNIRTTQSYIQRFSSDKKLATAKKLLIPNE